MRFHITIIDTYYRWDCWYREEVEFDTEQQVLDYCNEIAPGDRVEIIQLG